MELKDFVKKVILDLDSGVTEANALSGRNIRFSGVVGQKTALEFDVAVTVESETGSEGGAGIKVWGIGLGGSKSEDVRNSTVSRVSFGIDISSATKQEIQEQNALFDHRSIDNQRYD
jgi:hypothetical protein